MGRVIRALGRAFGVAREDRSRARGLPRRARAVRLAIATGAAILGLITLFRAPAAVELVELRLRDWQTLLRGPRQPPPRITVVAIDEKSLAAIGHWPWPRTRTAELVLRLVEGGARVVALDILLNEPDQNSSLALARSLVERYHALGLDRAGEAHAPFGRALEEALAQADTDARLAEALEAAGRVVLPYVFVFPPASARAIDEDTRRLLNRSRLVAFAGREATHALEPRRAAGVLLPLPRFLAAAAGSGHANVLPDRDGALRRLELAVRFADGYFPSFVLEAARVGLGLPRARVRLTAEQRLDLGTLSVPTDEDGLIHLSYYGPAGTFPRLSAADVLQGTTAPPVADHLVLVGFTALGLMDVRATPFDPAMPGVEIHANALANLLEGRPLRRLGTTVLLEALAVLLLAAGPPLILPRRGAIAGSLMVGGIALLVVAAAHAAFRAGMLVTLLPPLLSLAAGHLGTVTYQVLAEERERRWIKRAFQQYVPAEVVEAVARNPAALAFGGERRELTILFSDIRGYTTFAEQHSPEEVVAVLHEYLTTMVDVVFRHQGTLDKFIGDAIMAVWGAPLPDPDHALHACQAAVDMAETLEQLNVQWAAEGRPPLQAGYGISTGEVVVGNLGSAQRFSYTVIGDHVNLAARLEGLNKEYETTRPILISESTYARIRGRASVRRLGSVRVKGKRQPVEIYELVDVERTSPGEAR